MTVTPDEFSLAEILGPSTRVSRRVEIYENDGVTLWNASPNLIDGSVSVDQARQERRTCEFTFDNTDGALDNYPGGFWYDKVIKAYRGVETDVGVWENQIGEFLIDNIATPHFPYNVSVSGRDYTKRLLKSKFPAATTFVSGQAPEALVQTIATNGGIEKFILPVSGKLTGADWTFERGDERWKAISDIAGSFGFELFFDAYGYLVMQEYADPLTTPEVWTFQTGPEVGNLVSIGKSASDDRIYNVIVVTGEASDVPPVWAEARNTEPTSPTHIRLPGETTGLEERVYTYVNPRVTTTGQCQDIADKFLKIHALEQFEITLEAIVIPWLEAGTVVRFVDPNPNQGEPDRYLLSNFTIPLSLGPMSATGKRVTIVG